MLPPIRLIIFDVDGVLTDGSIIISDSGVESKRFHARDGLAMKAAMASGLKVGILTSRASRALTLRMAEIGVDLVVQRAPNKVIGLETLCQRAGVMPEAAAYVGDDLVDLAAMVRCAYPIAVADAVDEIKAEARYVTAARGGHDAARQAIEHILKAQNKWDEVVERYGI